MTAQKKDDFFSEENVAQSNWFSFEKVGDSIKGTLTAKRFQQGTGDYPDQEVYELLTESGEMWNVGISVVKRYVIDRMRNVKIGQVVGFMFKKEIPSKTKGWAAAKSIEVYVGEINEDYISDQVDAAVAPPAEDNDPENAPFAD